MGNLAGKDGFGPSGSHFDFFQTPPSSPSVPDLQGMPLPSSSAPPSPSETASEVAPATASLSQTEDAPLAETAAEVEGVPCIEGAEGRSLGAASGCVTGGPLQGVVTGNMAIMGGDMQGVVTEGVAMTLLQQLLEQHRAVAGLCTGQDGVAEVLGVLKRLVVERAQFIEEVQSLKNTLESERTEWLQFQSDLQVAVAVADRLRMEAEEGARALRFSQQAEVERLEATQALLQQAESNLETLRAQYTEACQRLEQEQLKAQSRPLQLDQSTQTNTEGRTSRIPMQDSGSGRTSGRGKAEEEGDGERGGKKTSEELELRNKRKSGEGSLGEGEARAFGSGVIDFERRTLPGFGLRDPRKIVMLSERSRSLSRLPLPSDPPPGLSGVSQTSSDVVGPASLSQDPGRDVGGGRRLDLPLQRQDSWSSFYTSKQDDDQSTDVSSVIVGKIRPEDSFSMLLRRHGGSRRNSLLRWCQRRTKGYKNIDITNFSTSWEDGLAFCAVYHTYLPTHIPYSTLNPDNKRENLDLAFRTGESVGVTATLTVEEMLSAGGPDWQRVLEYVESMFRHFEM
ncbi:cytospin-A-like isoform X2 [Clupea harengus]|uniref:Cytospin-A n=1 Tax=Clupea harengus TaxID=7950 RepID=A0A6P8GF49_CLUHA|nr:cytospin-A-like isoform X2 [Clupea harengus]